MKRSKKQKEYQAGRIAPIVRFVVQGYITWIQKNTTINDGAKIPDEASVIQALKETYPGDKLRAEGSKLWAEGNKLWAEAILQVHGNIKLEWKNWSELGYECHLETGEVFKPSDVVLPTSK